MPIFIQHSTPMPILYDHIQWQKMLLFHWLPLDGVLLFYIAAAAAEDLPHKDYHLHMNSGRRSDGPVGKSVLLMCVPNCCMFSGELISVDTTLEPAGQVWQTTTGFSLRGNLLSLVVILITAALKLNGLLCETIVTLQFVMSVSLPRDSKQIRVGVDLCFPCICLIEYFHNPLYDMSQKMWEAVHRSGQRPLVPKQALH